MSYSLQFLFGFLTSVIVIISKKPFERLALSAASLLDTLLIQEKEEEFIVALQQNLKRAVKDIVVFIFCVVFILIPILFYLHYFDSKNSSLLHVFLFFLGSTLPFFIVSRFITNKSDYSFLSQLLHRIILNHYNLGKWMLMKQIRFVTNTDIVTHKSIIITGLARSGTTALVDLLNKNGNFTSLNYSNMPFLLYPRIWSRIYKPSKIELKQRAHNDGIKVGLASVEALEEYFFKVVLNDSYIQPHGLMKHELSEELLQHYYAYQVSISKGKTYLAKNNNQILRLKSVMEFHRDTHVFILYRDPLEHSYSLLSQHLNFCRIQKDDPFALQYMNWLGHHEFGLNHKPFLFNLDFGKSSYTPFDIEYWVECWIEYYSYALNIEACTFLSYEEFLSSPEKILSTISKNTNEVISCDGIQKFYKDKKEIQIRNKILLTKARTIYDELENKAKIQSVNH